MKFSKVAAVVFTAVTLLNGCSDNIAPQKQNTSLLPEYQNKLDIYETVTLKADLSHLSANQKKMLALLIDASVIMDQLFWQQSFGEDKAEFLAGISDEKARRFNQKPAIVAINASNADELVSALDRRLFEMGRVAGIATSETAQVLKDNGIVALVAGGADGADLSLAADQESIDSLIADLQEQGII